MKLAAPVSVWVGTRKGAFVFRSTNRKSWDCGRPFFRGSEVNHVAPDPRNPKRLYCSREQRVVRSPYHASSNGGKSWKLSEDGFEIKSLPGAKLARTWHIEPGHADQPGVVYAGADPGVLFRSENWGKSWQEVTSLNRHKSRSKWGPGGGGMMVHSIQCLSKDSVVVGLSVAGAFRFERRRRDLDASQRRRTRGFSAGEIPEVGQCVHKLLAHPRNPKMLYQQNHCGVYRARFDARRWTDLSAGLPAALDSAWLSRPMSQETLFTVPWRVPISAAISMDGASRAQPRRRQKLDTPRQRSSAQECICGSAAGSNGVGRPVAGGSLLRNQQRPRVSTHRNAGDSWHTMAENLPPIYSVSVSNG
jgi:hypothetical protein